MPGTETAYATARHARAGSEIEGGGGREQQVW